VTTVVRSSTTDTAVNVTSMAWSATDRTFHEANPVNARVNAMPSAHHLPVPGVIRGR
jgi:hypothetical protein